MHAMADVAKSHNTRVEAVVKTAGSADAENPRRVVVPERGGGRFMDET